MCKVFLILVVVIIVIFVFVISRKLKEGERKIRQGKQKIAANDNWFVRLVAGNKLADGRRQIAEGEQKLSFWKNIRFFLVVICIGCIVGLILGI